MNTLCSVLSWLATATPKMFYLVHPEEVALDMEDKNPMYLIRYGVPMFFIMIVAEALYISISRGLTSRKGGNHVFDAYRLNDAISCAILGAGQIIFQTACQIVGIAVDAWAYTWVWERYRLFTIDSKAHPYFVFVAIMLGKDLGYYWMHRTMHAIHVMWSAHSVHHSGEDFTLPTALRQGALQPLMGFMFYFPLAILGFSPRAFAVHSDLNTLYQFWFHTDVINRLPFGLEYVINTPMAHRLHHRPPGNCNYAGVLIIWDRIFGTYEAETVRKNLYGLASQPQTFDVMKLNVQHFQRIKNIKDTNNGNTSWLYKLFARRANHAWQANIMNLFEPIAPLTKDIRSEGPKRKKWNGARPMGRAEAILVVVLTLFAFYGVLAMTLTFNSMHWYDAAGGAVLTGLMCSLVGRICDMRPGESDVAMLLSPLVVYAFFYVVQEAPVSKALA